MNIHTQQCISGQSGNGHSFSYPNLPITLQKQKLIKYSTYEFNKLAHRLSTFSVSG